MDDISALWNAHEETHDENRYQLEFMHRQMSEFQLLYEEFMMNDEQLLVIADGYNNKKQLFVHLIANLLVKSYPELKATNETKIDGDKLPETITDGILRETLQNSVPVFCQLWREERLSGLPRLMLEFSKDNFNILQADNSSESEGEQHF